MRANTVRSTELEIYCSDYTVTIMIAVDFKRKVSWQPWL